MYNYRTVQMYSVDLQKRPVRQWNPSHNEIPRYIDGNGTTTVLLQSRQIIIVTNMMISHLRQSAYVSSIWNFLLLVCILSHRWVSWYHAQRSDATFCKYIRVPTLPSFHFNINSNTTASRILYCYLSYADIKIY